MTRARPPSAAHASGGLVAVELHEVEAGLLPHPADEVRVLIAEHADRGRALHAADPAPAVRPTHRREAGSKTNPRKSAPASTRGARVGGVGEPADLDRHAHATSSASAARGSAGPQQVLADEEAPEAAPARRAARRAGPRCRSPARPRGPAAPGAPARPRRPGPPGRCRRSRALIPTSGAGSASTRSRSCAVVHLDQRLQPELPGEPPASRRAARPGSMRAMSSTASAPSSAASKSCRGRQQEVLLHHRQRDRAPHQRHPRRLRRRRTAAR